MTPRIEAGERLLPGERRRDRRGVRPARALRDRRSAPPHVPDGCGSPVGLLEQLVATGASLAQPRAPQGGARRPRGARRSRDRAGPAPSRPRSPGGVRTMTTDELRAFVRDVPDFPTRGNRLQGPHAADRRRRGVPLHDPSSWPSGPRPRKPDVDPRRRGARVHLRRGARVRARLRVRAARKPGKLPWETVDGDVRARVRHRLARGARGRARARGLA